MPRHDQTLIAQDMTEMCNLCYKNMKILLQRNLGMDWAVQDEIMAFYIIDNTR